MVRVVEAFEAPAFDDFLDVLVELSSRRFHMPIAHNEFCLYTVYLADASYHSYCVDLVLRDYEHYIIERILYEEDLNFTEYYECIKKLSPAEFETKNIIICQFGGDGKEEFNVRFENDEKEYFFKPEYPHFLNWVYMIACSFKNKTPLEITFRKESSSEYRVSHEILNIKLEGIA